MSADEKSVGTQSLLNLMSGPLRLARLRGVWPRLLVIGGVGGVAAAGAARILLPRTQGTGQVLPDVLGALSALAGFGALVYYLVVFGLNRRLRDAFLCAAFAALASAGTLLVLAPPADWSGAPNDRLFLIGWLYAGALMSGACYSQSSMRFAGKFRSVLGYLAAGLGFAAFPVVAALCSAYPDVADRFRRFPNDFWAPQVDSWIAFSAAVLLAAAGIGAYRRAGGQCDRSDRILAVFYTTAAVGLVCRATATATADALWLAGQIVSCGAWVALAAGFMGYSAVVNNELLDRLGELEALHELSWSLVGARDSDEFMHALAETLRGKLHAEIVALYLGDSGGGILSLAARSGGGDCYAPIGSKYAATSEDRRPGFHSGHTAAALRTSEVRTADDVFIDVEFVPWRIIARSDGRAISLPLIDQGNAIGVLNLYYSHYSQVTSQSMSLLQTIAAALGPAIGSVWRQRCEAQLSENREAA